MSILGILGGIAPESTIDYYRALVAGYRARSGDGSYPSIVITSIDLQRLLALVGSGELGALAEYLSSEIARLARAGATVGLLASNTPHIIFDELQRRSPIPLLSIVEATRSRAEDMGLTAVGLIGTQFTMSGGFYQASFLERGISVALPSAADQELIHRRYVGELVNGVYLPRTRDEVLAIVRRLRDEHHVQAVILGGTELPLLLRDYDPGVLLLDTTQIHVERAISALLA